MTFECPLQSQSSVNKRHLKEAKKKECEENREEIKDFFFQEEGGDENKLGVEKVVEEKEGQPASHCTALQNYTVNFTCFILQDTAVIMLLFNHHCKLLVLEFESLNHQSNIKSYEK